jgi:ABC-type multidrug transport system fused ATPase/permease subunit
MLENGQIVEYGSRQHLAKDPQSRFAELLKTGLNK